VKIRNITRRVLQALAISTTVAATSFLPVAAQDKPVVRILVGFPAGAGTDTLARIYAEALSQQLNVTTVVDNRPGAGGQIAAQALKNATPDSNTIMFTVDHQVIMVPLIVKNPGFDVKKDLVPVAKVVNFYTCLAVPATSQAQNFQQYLDIVRKDPLQGNVGVPAPGSQAQFVSYVVGQHFKVPLNSVPYKGAAPTIVDLIGGQIPAAIVPCDGLVEHRKGGKVRVLAMAAEKRYSAMPDVPTFGELGVKMPADAFLGVYASPNLKPEMLRQITDATRKMFDNPDVVKKFASTNMEPAYAGPQELQRFVENASTYWAEQVRKSNFQAQ
jgi:tripartite-type tricarboxylate transporter receptor subunit TctC